MTLQKDRDVNGNISTPLAPPQRIVHTSNTEWLDIAEYVDSTSPSVHARYDHGQPKLAATRIQTVTTQKKSTKGKKWTAADVEYKSEDIDW
ncbi:hypothetical protein K435DRAFT_870108 [Dendrothele bispora CBS 962.96]|uniref:Uncharacterized protein n=1 Tax=Dendrothele bispora (strain CBS 962.96) TaxID=1314807 RepID=A0A4S8L8T1_DENBC|nr:hypothetical protein K435DRAFT_870108 [Dendrothele bispora CBS 962.96]